MRKLLSVAIALLLMPSVSFAAIAFDNATVQSSQSFSYTVTGTNPVLIAWLDSGATTNPSAVTYNGQSLTLVDAQLMSGGNGKMWLYVLPAPPTGAHTFTVTGASGFGELVASYSGTDQTNPIESNDSRTTNSGVTSINETMSSIADNAWHVAGAFSPQTQSAGTATTRRAEGVVGQGCCSRGAVFDNNAAITPPGSNTLNWTLSNSAVFYFGLILVPPAPLSAPPAQQANFILFGDW